MSNLGHAKPRKINCFTEEEQLYYDKLSVRKRLYVDFRAANHGKTESARMAGYGEKHASQTGYLIEKNDPRITKLIEVRLRARAANELLTKPESSISAQIAAISSRKDVEQALKTVDKADPELLGQISFFRDVATGKIKTVRKTTYIDKHKNKSFKIEEIDDVDVRIRAQKELGRLLGIKLMPDVGKIEAGEITINIVNARRKEITKGDDKIYAELKAKEETLEGEVVLVEEDIIDKSKSRTRNIVAHKPVVSKVSNVPTAENNVNEDSASMKFFEAVQHGG